MHNYRVKNGISLSCLYLSPNSITSYAASLKKHSRYTIVDLSLELLISCPYTIRVFLCGYYMFLSCTYEAIYIIKRNQIFWRIWLSSLPKEVDDLVLTRGSHRVWCNASWGLVGQGLSSQILIPSVHGGHNRPGWVVSSKNMLLHPWKLSNERKARVCYAGATQLSPVTPLE
jgi:hypothetical protein